MIGDSSICIGISSHTVWKNDAVGDAWKVWSHDHGWQRTGSIDGMKDWFSICVKEVHQSETAYPVEGPNELAGILVDA